MRPVDPRLQEAYRLDKPGTDRRVLTYTWQRTGVRFGRKLHPTSAQVRRIVKKARRHAVRGAA